MKKIPALFEREYENHKVVGITDKLTNPAFQDILDHPARYHWTVKFDGTCCCVMNGIVYKRYDAKRGKKAPEGAIPCCETFHERRNRVIARSLWGQRESEEEL